MAVTYDYTQQSIGNKGWVKYNITPGYNTHNEITHIGAGDTITINGQVYWSTNKLASLEVFLYPSYSYPQYVLAGMIQKTVKKATKATFSVSFTVTQEMIDTLISQDETQGEYQTGFIGFNLVGATTSLNTETNLHESFNLIKQRVSPSASVTLSDLVNTVDGENTLYSYFGGYIRRISKPRITATFNLDGRDHKLTATHKLTITGGSPSQSIVKTATTGVGDHSIYFDLDALNCTETLSYQYKITDSAGNSNTYLGAFIVYNYSNPSISTFVVQRYKHVIDEGDVIAEDGNKVLMSITCSTMSVNSKNAWSLNLSYNPIDETPVTTINAASGDDGSSYTTSDNKTIVDSTISPSKTFTFILTLTDKVMSTTLSVDILKAGAYFNIEKTGVAVGMRTTGTSNNKKFEVAEDYTSIFYGDVDFRGQAIPNLQWVDMELNNSGGGLVPRVISPNENYYGGGRLQITKNGSHVYIKGGVTAVSDTLLATIPVGYRPSSGARFKFAPSSGATIARLCAKANGEFYLEWVRKISDASGVISADWIDCNMDYWID